MLLFQNEEVPGYTKSVNNQWLYSQEAINLVHTYAEKFPILFQLMNKQNNAHTDPLFEEELNVGKKVKFYCNFCLRPILIRKNHNYHLSIGGRRRCFEANPKMAQRAAVQIGWSPAVWHRVPLSSRSWKSC